MKKTIYTVSQKKRIYQAPEIKEFIIDTRATLMATSESITGDGPATDLWYGGVGDDEYGD